jgi:hypothetical protein
MARHDKVKIKGANEQTRGKNRSSNFVLTAFICFGLFNIFCCMPGLDSRYQITYLSDSSIVSIR